MRPKNFPALLKLFAIITSICIITGACSDSSDNPLVGQGTDQIAPSIPGNLTFISVGNGEIHLTWDSVPEADVAGYRLYRTENEDTPANYVMIFDSLDTEYIDLNLEYTTRYYYRVSAYDLSGNESEQSDAVQGMPQNTQPPGRPAGLAVNAYNIESPVIRLFWSANTETDLRGYNIYRGTTAGTVTQLIDSTLNIFYDDTTIEIDTVYYYKITAYDRGGEESAPTDPESDAALSPPEPTAPIGGVSVDAPPIFAWAKVPNAEQYKVFAQTTSLAGEFWTALVHKDSSTVQYDGSTVLDPGKLYYWKVATITKDTTGLNSISSTESFRIK